ncbi:MAG: hypothetical protein ACE5GG_03330 [Candidatus Omnitrophota bacterium]
MGSVFRYISRRQEYFLKEEGWRKEEQGARESRFALGNGFLGIRGVLEEHPQGAQPGTYIAGLYDKATAQVRELVNLPNPLSFKVVANEEKLGMSATGVLDHQRVLGMRKAMLFRRTIYLNRFSRRVKYESLRFLSRKDKGLGVMRVQVSPLDRDAILVAQAGVDVSVANKGVLSEGRKNHFSIEDVQRLEDIRYLFYQARINGYWVCRGQDNRCASRYRRRNLSAGCPLAGVVKTLSGTQE